MKTKNEITPIEVYSGNSWETKIVKSLLENAEIQTFLKDEIYGSMAPWVTAGGGAGSIKVVVSSADVEKARLIVEEFEKNR